MKKKTITLFFFLLSFSLSGQAQPLYLHSTKFFGSQGNDRAFDAILSPDSSIIFVGSTTDTSGNYDFPSSPPDSLDPYLNLVVGRIDTNMQVAWTRVYRGSREESGRCIRSVPSGGFVVLGNTRSQDGDVSFNHGQYDLWLLRLDSLGGLLWQRTYGSSLSESPISLITTSDGGFLFFGTSNGSDGDVPSHYGGFFSFDLFVVKTDGSGNIEWTRTLGGSGDEGHAGGLLEVNGHYYVVSSSNSYDHDCNDVSWRSGPHSDPDFYMFKLDPAGNLVWSKSYGGSGNDNAVNVSWDVRDSSIVINGSTRSYDYMVQNSNSINYDNIWIIKTDLDGNLQWAKTLIDSNSHSLSSGLLPYSNGGYILIGECNAGFPVKPGRAGSFDARIFLLDSTGNSFYDKVFGGVFSEGGGKTLLTYKGGYTVIGGSVSENFTEGQNLNMNFGVNEGSSIFVSVLFPFPDPLLSVQQKRQADIIKVFPNPAQGMVKILLPDTEGQLSVIDINGRTVHRQATQRKPELSLNTATWPRGTYIVEWRGKDRQLSTGKLVIVR